jgi:Type IX secretion system membrane protein PorP/SprF
MNSLIQHKPQHMKRIRFVIPVLMILGASPINAQQFQLRGLEIYNPYYHNPAYVQAEKTVQLDFIGYNFSFLSGMWTSVMTTLPEYNSSGGIRLAQGSYEGTADFWNLQLAYAYKHSFSGNLQLNGGIQFSSGHTIFEDDIFGSVPEELKARHNGYLGLGVALEYHKLHAGLSSSFPLYLRREVLLEDNTTETQKDDADIINFNFLTGYSLGKPGRLTFDPILRLDYRMLYGGRNNELKAYVGANLQIRDLLGFGFTMGNLTSFSTSLSFMDRVTLILGIYAGEHELFGPVESTKYTIGSKEFDIIGQIRVNL